MKWQAEINYTIYAVVNKVNQKQYVGYTALNPPQKRFRQHLKAAETGRDYCLLYRAIRKYGADNFDFEILQQGRAQLHLALKFETFFIIHRGTYKTRWGYNSIEHTYPLCKMAKAERARMGSLQASQPKFQEARALAAKKRKKPVICLQTCQVYASGLEAAIDLALSPGHISRVLSGTRRHTKGYSFRFYQETDAPQKPIPFVPILDGLEEGRRLTIRDLGKKVRDVNTGCVYESISEYNRVKNSTHQRVKTLIKDGKLVFEDHTHQSEVK